MYTFFCTVVEICSDEFKLFQHHSQGGGKSTVTAKKTVVLGGATLMYAEDSDEGNDFEESHGE